MKHEVIHTAPGTSKQRVKCCYVRCATEVIERTKSYDCVRVYHCHDGADSRNSEQINPPPPAVAGRNHLVASNTCTQESQTSDRAQRRKEKKLRKRQLNDQMKNEDIQPLSMRITTTKFHPNLDKNATNRSIVHVKPLIVLDLNGILCHRVRTTPLKSSTSQNQSIFRPSCGNISNTDIIPRSDLLEFLTLLHGNFCLGVWTSATRKTSKLLIDALFPTNIRERLVFVWHRSFCQLVKKNVTRSYDLDEESEHSEEYTNNTSKAKNRGKKRRRMNEGKNDLSCLEDVTIMDRDKREKQSTIETENSKSTKSQNGAIYNDDVTAIKPLSKVWDAFPLWDDSNTILLDDSPEKCPIQFRENALHPPPIRGTITARMGEDRCSDMDSYSILDDDEVNQRRQRDFFHLLAKHWEQPTKNNLTDFLEKHANDHNMRWKTGS